MRPTPAPEALPIIPDTPATIANAVTTAPRTNRSMKYAAARCAGPARRNEKRTRSGVSTSIAVSSVNITPE